MPFLGEVLRSFADPFGPLLRERIERALPPGSNVADLVIDATEARVVGLTVPIGPLHLVAPELRFRLALLSRGAKAHLRDTTATVRDASGSIVARIAFESFERRDAWAAGTVVVTAGDLEARARLEVDPSGARARDLRITGKAGTAVEGAVALVDDTLEGTLEGTVAARDLLSVTGHDPTAWPIDPRETIARIVIAIGGRVSRPRARLSLSLRDVPLREPGRKRFLPHLRLADAALVVGVEGHRKTVEGKLDFVGGGSLALRGDDDGARRGLDATLVALDAAAVRHVLELVGASGIGWLRGEVGGSARYEDDGRSPRVAVRLASREVVLAVGAATFPFEGVTATLEGPLPRPPCTLEGTLDGGALSVTLAPDVPPVVVLRGASPHALARLALADPTMVPLVVEGTAPPKGGFVLPARWRVDVRAEPGKGRLAANVALGEGASSIEIAIASSDGAHAGSRIRGAVTPEDAAILFDVAARNERVAIAGAPLRFDLAIEGSAAAPSLRGTIAGDESVLRYDTRTLSVGALRADVHVAPRFVAFTAFRAEIGRGALLGEGVIVLGDELRGRAAFVSENIRIGRQELFPEGVPLDGRAFAHAEVAFVGGGASAEVRVRLDEPRYPFLPSVTARLGKLGLPPLSIDGDRPLEAHAWASRDVVEVCSVRAGVVGVSARGSGRASEKGNVLTAEVDLTAQPSWLAKSPLLRVPSFLLGPVDVPIKVRGSLASPETTSDLLRAVVRALGRGIGVRHRSNGLLALPPKSLSVPSVPFADGTDDMTDLHALAKGTLPLADLEAVAERFVARARKE